MPWMPCVEAVGFLYSAPVGHVTAFHVEARVPALELNLYKPAPVVVTSAPK